MSLLNTCKITSANMASCFVFLNLCNNLIKVIISTSVFRTTVLSSRLSPPIIWNTIVTNFNGVAIVFPPCVSRLREIYQMLNVFALTLLQNVEILTKLDGSATYLGPTIPCLWLSTRFLKFAKSWKLHKFRFREVQIFSYVQYIIEVFFFFPINFQPIIFQDICYFL